MTIDFKTPLNSTAQCAIQNVVCSALPDDYPTQEECDKIEEEYRQAHWCPRCLAMFEEECVCDYDEDE